MSGGELNPAERRRRTRCYLLAAASPVAAALSATGVLVALLGLDAPRSALDIAVTVVPPAHCIVGAACAFAAVLRLHPVPAGRLAKALLWAVASVPIFVALIWVSLGASLVLYLAISGESFGPD